MDFIDSRLNYIKKNADIVHDNKSEQLLTKWSVAGSYISYSAFREHLSNLYTVVEPEGGIARMGLTSAAET